MILEAVLILLLMQVCAIANKINNNTLQNSNAYFKEKLDLNVDTIGYKIKIYHICPIPKSKGVNFYGNYNDLTIVGNMNYTKVFNLYPSPDSHVCYEDGLYFVASNMLCMQSYSEEIGKIKCRSIEEGILSFKVSNSYNSSFFHMSITTPSTGYFCSFPNMSCIVNPFHRFNNISSIVSISDDEYLISGFDNPLCYIKSDNIFEEFSYLCVTKSIGEGKVIKSGGTYDPNQDTLYKIELIDRVYLIQLDAHTSFATKSAYKIKDEFKDCLFTGFVEVRDSRLYTLLRCESKSIILMQRNLETPIAYYTDSLYEYTAGVSKSRFLLFSKYDNILSFNFSNAPLNSIHSIDSFNIVNFYTMAKLDIFELSIYNEKSKNQNITFNKTLIEGIFKASIKSKSLVNFQNIYFNNDDCFANTIFNNTKYILLNTLNCKLITSSDRENISYSTSYFQDSNSSLIQFDDIYYPSKLTNIPLTKLKDKNETRKFIVNAFFRNHSYQSLVYITIGQCKNYCKECDNNICSKCLHSRDENDDTCSSKQLYNLAYFDIIIATALILILFFIAIFHIGSDVYVNACNHYQSLFLISFLSLMNYNSLKFAAVILYTFSPFITPFVGFGLYDLTYSEELPPNRNTAEYIFGNIYYDYTIPILFGSYLILSILNYTLSFMCFCKLKNSAEYYLIYANNSAFYLILHVFWMMYLNNKFLYLYNLDIYVGFSCFIIVFYLTTADFKYIIKAYTMKLFNMENEEAKPFIFFFNGLRNDPEALLYNIANILKRYITFLILFIRSILVSYSNLSKSQGYIINLMLLLSLMFVELLWLYYLIKAQPYRSLSSNRILIVNQLCVMTLGICSTLSLLIVIITDDLKNDYLDIIDWISSILVLPISYFLFSIHYSIIKICYKTKKNIVFPRFWKQKNPNIHFATESSFTAYMAYNPYGEYES